MKREEKKRKKKECYMTRLSSESERQSAYHKEAKKYSMTHLKQKRKTGEMGAGN